MTDDSADRPVEGIWSPAVPGKGRLYLSHLGFIIGLVLFFLSAVLFGGLVRLLVSGSAGSSALGVLDIGLFTMFGGLVLIWFSSRCFEDGCFRTRKSPGQSFCKMHTDGPKKPEYVPLEKAIPEYP